LELSKSKIILNWSKRILPIIIGAIAGFLYYNFIGCVSGACPITGNPWLSTGYGALVGLVFTAWKPGSKD
jgi:Family of unknown function (DUF6132)